MARKRTVSIEGGLSKAGNQVFKKIKGVEEIKVTSKGNITVPDAYIVKIKFKPAKGHDFTKNGRGKYIELSKSGVVIDSEDSKGIDLDDDNTTGTQVHEIEYELYVSHQKIDPRIINQGSGGGPFARMRPRKKSPKRKAPAAAKAKKTAKKKTARGKK